MEPKFSAFWLPALYFFCMHRYGKLFTHGQNSAQNSANDFGFNRPRQQQQFATPLQPQFILQPPQQNNNFLPQKQQQQNNDAAGIGQHPAQQPFIQQQQPNPQFTPQFSPQPPVFNIQQQQQQRPATAPSQNAADFSFQQPVNNFDINTHPLMTPNDNRNFFAQQSPPIISTTTTAPTPPPRPEQVFDLARDQIPTRPSQQQPSTNPTSLRPDTPRQPSLATPPTQLILATSGNRDPNNNNVINPSGPPNNFFTPQQQQQQQRPLPQTNGPLRPDQFDRTPSASPNVNSRPELFTRPPPATSGSSQQILQTTPSQTQPRPPLRPIVPHSNRQQQAQSLANDNVASSNNFFRPALTEASSQQQQQKPLNFSFGFGPSRGQLFEFQKFQLQKQQQQQQQNDAQFQQTNSLQPDTGANRLPPIQNFRPSQTQSDAQQALTTQQQQELAELQRELNTVDNFFVKNDIIISSIPPQQIGNSFVPSQQQQQNATPPTLVKASVPFRDQDFFRPTTTPANPLFVSQQQRPPQEQARFDATDAPGVASTNDVSINRIRLIQQAKPLQAPVFSNQADVFSLTSRNADDFVATGFKKQRSKFANPQANAMAGIKKVSVPVARVAPGIPFDFSAAAFEKFLKQNSVQVKPTKQVIPTLNGELALVQQKAITQQKQQQQSQNNQLTVSTEKSKTLATSNNVPQTSVIFITNPQNSPTRQNMALAAAVLADKNAIQENAVGEHSTNFSTHIQAQNRPTSVENLPRVGRRLNVEQQQLQQDAERAAQNQQQSTSVVRTPLNNSQQQQQQQNSNFLPQFHDDRLPLNSVGVEQVGQNQRGSLSTVSCSSGQHCPPIAAATSQNQPNYYSPAGERSLFPPLDAYKSGVQTLQNTFNAGVSYVNSFLPNALTDSRLLLQYVPPLLAPIVAPLTTAAGVPTINAAIQPPLQPRPDFFSNSIENFNPGAGSFVGGANSAVINYPPVAVQPGGSYSSTANLFAPHPYPPPAPPSVVAEAIAQANPAQNQYPNRQPGYVELGPLPNNKPTRTEYQTDYVQMIYDNNLYQQHQQQQPYQPYNMPQLTLVYNNH